MPASVRLYGLHVGTLDVGRDGRLGGDRNDRHIRPTESADRLDELVSQRALLLDLPFLKNLATNVRTRSGHLSALLLGDRERVRFADLWRRAET